MSTVNDEPLLTGAELHQLYQSSDKLLRFAEVLEEKCQSYENRLHRMTVALLCTIPVAGVLITCLVLRGPVTESMILQVVVYILLLSISMIDAYVLFALRVVTLDRLATDRRAMFGIVDMLREIDPGSLGGDNLSTLEKVEFRIRLSRFDIGPGTSPASTGSRR